MCVCISEILCLSTRDSGIISLDQNKAERERQKERELRKQEGEGVRDMMFQRGKPRGEREGESARGRTGESFES